MSVLVLVEHDGKSIKDSTLATVTAASRLGEVHALVAGSGIGPVAEAAAKITGVAKVIAADAPHTRPVYALLENLRDRSIAVHARGIQPPSDLNSPQRIAASRLMRSVIGAQPATKLSVSCPT